MEGAAAQLSAAGFCVDATQSRAFIGGIDDIQKLHAAGKLGQVVVVALGTNGPIGNGQLTAMMNELAQVPHGRDGDHEGRPRLRRSQQRPHP